MKNVDDFPAWNIEAGIGSALTPDDAATVVEVSMYVIKATRRDGRGKVLRATAADGAKAWEKLVEAIEASEYGGS